MLPALNTSLCLFLPEISLPGLLSAIPLPTPNLSQDSPRWSQWATLLGLALQDWSLGVPTLHP